MLGKVGMKKYPIEVREKIVKEYNNGKSQNQLSKEHGITRYAIQCWIRARTKKNVIPKQRKKSAKTLQEYKNENERLKMENELLRAFLLLIERK